MECLLRQRRKLPDIGTQCGDLGLNRFNKRFKQSEGFGGFRGEADHGTRVTGTSRSKWETCNEGLKCCAETCGADMNAPNRMWNGDSETNGRTQYDEYGAARQHDTFCNQGKNGYQDAGIKMVGDAMGSDYKRLGCRDDPNEKSATTTSMMPNSTISDANIEVSSSELKRAHRIFCPTDKSAWNNRISCMRDFVASSIEDISCVMQLPVASLEELKNRFTYRILEYCEREFADAGSFTASSVDHERMTLLHTMKSQKDRIAEFQAIIMTQKEENIKLKQELQRAKNELLATRSNLSKFQETAQKYIYEMSLERSGRAWTGSVYPDIC